jgi:hypothetical protein
MPNAMMFVATIGVRLDMVLMVLDFVLQTNL